MASEDVIELGSSEDETEEPAPKKSKKLPPKNAMVCIPTNLRDVTIKPAVKSAKINPLSLAKGLGKGVTVTRVSNAKTVNAKAVNVKIANVRGSVKQVNPLAVAKKNGKSPVKGPINITNLKKIVAAPMNLPNIPKKTFKSARPTNQADLLIRNLNSKTIYNNKPVPLQNSNIKINNKIKINNTVIPSGITLKKSIHTVVSKPILFMNTNKLPQSADQAITKELLTVNLDDDESAPATSNPQWYLRPEEQDNLTETDPLLQEENNKEPETPNMIEITIEDSPVKPARSKRAFEVGAELAITIEDSPVKPAPSIDEQGSGSEAEDEIRKEPNSKKKLEYPKESENIVEIEIEPMKVTNTNNNDAVIEVSISDTSKKISESQIKPTCNNKVEISDNEFHPIYQSFINLCFELENSDDMKKIVDKKIKSYYLQVPKDYTESEEFLDMVSSKIIAMKAGPEKMYLYIKDIVDELNMQRKLAKTQPVKENKTDEPAPFLYGEESEYDTKRQRQIRKLEKTIKKLHRAIQKLEEQEVDFDDDDDSVYLLTERYKERMVRVYAKFCQLTNTKMPSEPRIQIDARPGQPSGPAKRLEKWINKKVPIGTPLPFPDFHDVLHCVREANEEDRLGLNEVDIMEEARDLFVRCGKKLQRRRQENEWRLAASRIALEVDPAEKSIDLQKKLDANKKLAANKETEIFNKYADRQNQLKLEAEEIGDKEAEESPAESEEEEVNEDSVSLENKDKRKERLKRLLQEKSKKDSQEKENHKEDKEESPIDVKPLEVTKEENVKEKDEEKNETSVKTSDKPSTDTITEKSCLNETLSVSDDSNEIESDIDELHLLQKLHSGSAHSSTQGSDSESPIAISDTLESSDDNKKRAADIISIENSSYSENEGENDEMALDDGGSVNPVISGEKDEDTQVIVPDSENTSESVHLINSDENSNEKTNQVPEDANVKLDDSKDDSVNSKKIQTTNNDEYNDSIENMLLASDDESESPANNTLCVNLRDDCISIEETVIDNFDNTLKADTRKDINVTTSEETISRDENVSNPIITDDIVSVSNVEKVRNDDKINPKAINDIILLENLVESKSVHSSTSNENQEKITKDVDDISQGNDLSDVIEKTIADSNVNSKSDVLSLTTEPMEVD